jgi:DNA-binding Xre family transcriptional regulator
MALAEAIAALMAARGMKPIDVAGAVVGWRDRATVYRVLNGETEDPRLRTVVELCNVLNVTPGELLRLSGLPDAAAVESAARDVALRHAMDDVQDLAEDDRQLVLDVIRGIADDRRTQARPSTRWRRGADGEDDTPA